MRALITGGAGFIGSHLSDYLLDERHHVIVVDDLSTGNISNIQRAKRSAHFEFHLDTILNRQLMTALIDRVDIVFHLAAAVGVRQVVASPVRTIKTNVGGTELILELASATKKRVLIMSTSEVYGKSAKIPFHEDGDLVLGPTSSARWSYASSKIVDEFLALAYYSELDLPTTIIRLFNTVGPRQTDRFGMVLPTFVRQALAGLPITVFGTGRQSRCFTHVADIVKGLIQCAISDLTIGQVFNLGNTEEITMNALAERVLVATESSSMIAHVPYDKTYGSCFEDMDRRVPDIAKARECFGYTPSHTLADAILSVATYYQNDKKIARSERSARFEFSRALLGQVQQD
jgi:UDP-glucose 4-epimerase